MSFLMGTIGKELWKSLGPSAEMSCDKVLVVV